MHCESCKAFEELKMQPLAEFVCVASDGAPLIALLFHWIQIQIKPQLGGTTSSFWSNSGPYAAIVHAQAFAGVALPALLR